MPEVLDKDSHYQYNYNVEGADGYSFQLYMRQNKELEDDFSCGLCWLMPSGDVLTLCRYNGSSHNDPNVIEKEYLGYNCHVHVATEKYIVANKKPDGYAKVNKGYSTLNGALHCLLKDCNIEGLNSQPDLPNII